MNFRVMLSVAYLMVVVAGCHVDNHVSRKNDDLEERKIPDECEVFSSAQMGRSMFLSRYGKGVRLLSLGELQVPNKPGVVRHLSTYTVKSDKGSYVISFDEDALVLLVWSSKPNGIDAIQEWSSDFLSTAHRD